MYVNRGDTRGSFNWVCNGRTERIYHARKCVTTVYEAKIKLDWHWMHNLTTTLRLQSTDYFVRQKKKNITCTFIPRTTTNMRQCRKQFATAAVQSKQRKCASNYYACVCVLLCVMLVSVTVGALEHSNTETADKQMPPTHTYPSRNTGAGFRICGTIALAVWCGGRGA